MLRDCQASLGAEGRRKKIQFVAPHGFGCRRSFSKVFACILVENHMSISMVSVR